MRNLKVHAKLFLFPLFSYFLEEKNKFILNAGELFGVLRLGNVLSEDTPAGRLILTNCSTLLLKPTEAGKTDDSNCKAYVAQIEDTGRSSLYLRSGSYLTDYVLLAFYNPE